MKNQGRPSLPSSLSPIHKFVGGGLCSWQSGVGGWKAGVANLVFGNSELGRRIWKGAENRSPTLHPHLPTQDP